MDALPRKKVNIADGERKWLKITITIIFKESPEKDLFVMTVSGLGLKHHEDNRPSLLLSAEENQMVVALVGPRCQTLSTTVAQVYRSEGPGHNYRWNKRTCGVICFVKDNLRRSYFIRVYDMDRTVLVFDQEIYNQFRFVSSTKQKFNSNILNSVNIPSIFAQSWLKTNQALF